MKKDKNIFIRVSTEELEIIEKKAKALDLSVSAYLRLVAIHTTVEIKTTK